MGTQSQILLLALLALRRNGVQTSLAMIGVSVGVSALVAGMALGQGAQEQISDQLLAAGANTIVVMAGNYQVEQAEGVSTPADHGSINSSDDSRYIARIFPLKSVPDAFSIGTADYTYGLNSDRQWKTTEVAIPRFIKTHFEDDPMAEHDHPTASDRLGDSMAGLGAAATLTIEDAERIRSEIPRVQFVASGVHENARVIMKGDESKRWLTRLHGTEAELSIIRPGWTFPYGKFLTEKQVENEEQVMVLGRVVSDRLFGEGVDPVGETLLLWNQEFEIIGVVGSKSWTVQPSAGDDQFDAVYVPVSTVHRLLNLSKLNTITVTTRSAGDTARVRDEIVNLLRQRHGISELMPDDFTVRSQAQAVLGSGLPPSVARIVAGNLASFDELTVEQLASSLQRSNRTMLALIAGVASVSLLVGGIGVTNLLLLSVTQRTREVGLKMAMGAHSSDIALQFISEAVLLSILGGLLGAGIGAVAAGILEGIFHWSTNVSFFSIVIAIAVAALLGIAASIFPARKAALMDPIGALQHE